MFILKNPGGSDTIKIREDDPNRGFLLNQLLSIGYVIEKITHNYKVHYSDGTVKIKKDKI